MTPQDPSSRTKQALSQLRKALRPKAPDLAARLAKPATADAVASLERLLGMPIPSDLRAFYSVADGDGPSIEDEPDITVFCLAQYRHRVSPPDTAVALVSLLVERGLVVPVEGCRVDDYAASVRTVLAGRGRAKTKAKKLLRLLEEAPWVDETFATEEALVVFVDEFL